MDISYFLKVVCLCLLVPFSLPDPFSHLSILSSSLEFEQWSNSGSLDWFPFYIGLLKHLRSTQDLVRYSAISNSSLRGCRFSLAWWGTAAPGTCWLWERPGLGLCWVASLLFFAHPVKWEMHDSSRRCSLTLHFGLPWSAAEYSHAEHGFPHIILRVLLCRMSAFLHQCLQEPSCPRPTLLRYFPFSTQHLLAKQIWPSSWVLQRSISTRKGGTEVEMPVLLDFGACCYCFWSDSGWSGQFVVSVEEWEGRRW